jgi:hypothetical protein
LLKLFPRQAVAADDEESTLDFVPNKWKWLLVAGPINNLLIPPFVNSNHDTMATEYGMNALWQSRRCGGDHDDDDDDGDKATIIPCV